MELPKYTFAKRDAVAKQPTFVTFRTTSHRPQLEKAGGESTSERPAVQPPPLAAQFSASSGASRAQGWGSSSRPVKMLSRRTHQCLSFLGLMLSCGFLALFAALCKLLQRNDSLRPLPFLAHRQALASLVLLPIALIVDGGRRPPRSSRCSLATSAILFATNLALFLFGLELLRQATRKHNTFRGGIDIPRGPCGRIVVCNIS